MSLKRTNPDNGVIPFLPIWKLIKGLSSEDILEFLEGLRHYVLKACQASLSCCLSELLGCCLSHLDLFLMLTHEVYEESINSVHIIWIGTCKAWWQLSLLGFWLTFKDLFNVHLPAWLGSGGVWQITSQSGNQLICQVCSGLWPAWHRASGQTDLPSAPVDLWIVFYQPHVSKDDGHSANTCEMAVGHFWMIPILHYEVDDFIYVACFNFIFLFMIFVYWYSPHVRHYIQ